MKSKATSDSLIGIRAAVFPLVRVLMLVGLIGGILAGLVALMTSVQGLFSNPVATVIVVTTLFLGGFIGVASAGGAVLCRLLVPQQRRSSWLGIAAIGVGAALGCTAGYLALFAGASESYPAIEIPVFDGVAVIVLCGVAALVRLARER
jgi:hypothetical protein